MLTILQTASEILGPTFGQNDIGAMGRDPMLNFDFGGLPVDERFILHGRALDKNDRTLPRMPVEIWQSNALGRDKKDIFLGTWEPIFAGCGKTLTIEHGCNLLRTNKPRPGPLLKSLIRGGPGKSMCRCSAGHLASD